MDVQKANSDDGQPLSMIHRLFVSLILLADKLIHAFNSQLVTCSCFNVVVNQLHNGRYAEYYKSMAGQLLVYMFWVNVNAK